LSVVEVAAGWEVTVAGFLARKLRSYDPNRRVAITGLGIVSPVGNDTATSWRNILDGVSGIERVTRFDPSPYERQVGGECRGFDPSLWMNPKAARRTDRVVQFAVAVAKQAVADSGLQIGPDNADGVGVVFCASGGGQEILLESIDAFRAKGHRLIPPFALPNVPADAAAGVISIETGARGVNLAVASACGTGTVAIGEAAHVIKRGDATAVIAGAGENAMLEWIFASFIQMRALGQPLPDGAPATASRPFDRTRDGFILSEGAAAMMLEDMDHARARGARIYAEVVGYGSTADAYDQIIPAPSGEGSARAMSIALGRAEIEPHRIGTINAHGTSTPLGDKRETEAIHSVFGEHTPKILVTSTKSMSGHMMSGSGAFEAVATALSLHEQVVPGTINYRDPDPECNLNVVAETTPATLEYALSNSVGLGGRNSALVLKRYSD
jgi:3-oxoacyl-[acyl-carrier-protein] synthase II